MPRIASSTIASACALLALAAIAGQARDVHAHTSADAAPAASTAAAPSANTAPWDRPTRDLRGFALDDPAPTFRLVGGVAEPLALDLARVALQPLPGMNQADLVLAQARHAGVEAKAARPLSAGLWELTLAQPLDTAAHLAGAIERLTAEAFAFASPVFAAPGIDDGVWIPTRTIIARASEAQTAAGAAHAALAQAAPNLTTLHDRVGDLPGAVQLAHPSRSGFDVLRDANRLAMDARFAWAAPIALASAQLSYTPNDPGWGAASDWGWDNDGPAFQGAGAIADLDTDADLAWNLHRGSPSMVVLVLDNGTQEIHPDLNIMPGRDFTTGAVNGVNSADPTNICENHGTAVAGVIAGRIDNGLGMAGVCPECRVLPAKILVQVPVNGTCPGNSVMFQDVWLANAIAWGVNQGARITNSSFASPVSDIITDAYNQASADEVINFAAAGNTSATSIAYPASLTSCQAVTGIDAAGTLLFQSGTGLDFCGPGSQVYTTDRTGAAGVSASDYRTNFSGTSCATPFVAGIAALFWSAFPDLSPTNVLFYLRTNSTDLGAPGYDTTFGWGFPNANALLNAVGPSNGWCATAPLIAVPSYHPAPYQVSASGASPAEPQESCDGAGMNVSNTVWYRTVQQTDGLLTISTAGSSYDTVVSIFDGTCANPVQIACDSDSGPGFTSLLSNIPITAGEQYLIKVSSRVNASLGGVLDFNYTFTPDCPADFNNSGARTVQDIFDFLAAYFAQLRSADFNASGAATVQDVFDFLAAYFAGCP